MAQTFEEQVEGKTQLSIASTATVPTQDELTQFLKDGIVDVINRIIEISPEEISKFTTTQTDSNNNGIEVIGKTVSIVREHDSATVLRPCSIISAQDRYEATDAQALKYRSKFNPGYYVLDGKIFSVPASASGNNALIVTQVFYPETSYSDYSISNFPDEFEHLVVIYASMESLEAKMAEYTITEEDSELTQAIGFSLGILSKEYDTAFAYKNATEQQQSQRGEE
jgi:septum formation topological specificity factor MinE